MGESIFPERVQGSLPRAPNRRLDGELLATTPVVIGEVTSMGQTRPAPACEGPGTIRATSYRVIGPLYISPIDPRRRSV